MKRIQKFVPIVAVTLLWGSMSIPSSYAVLSLTPIGVLFLRSLFSLFVLFPVILIREKDIMPCKEELLLVVSMAFFGVILCNYFYFYALAHTSVTNVAVIYALGPILTTVLASFLLHEFVGRRTILGTSLAFIGVLLLLTEGDPRLLIQNGIQEGDLSELCSVLCLAVYTILSRKIKRSETESVTLLMMIIATFVSFFMLYLSGQSILFSMDAVSLLSAAYLGIFCSGLGYLFQQKSIQSLGASISSCFLYAVSPITLLCAAVFLGEELSALQLMCMGFVLLGIYLCAGSLPSKRGGREF